MTLEECFPIPLTWARSGQPERPYCVTVDGTPWVIQINEFPEEALYTLLINDAEAGSFDDWPPAWTRPT